eukprot:CAMPEP_0206028002 /NCGR_PEP_ID=MMETSP1464-20131121/44180_1 /ASSEMBLY_ACC=CAM_ASM_001124 /TAXON_ID=119497 /ORGANISM="Exanthemachrysis gayraliae, Strain RCC1523" /LENGTH=41 /DNA_ID= /DNA_START= /DNA_END= /DNA_ORIENTATION=
MTRWRISLRVVKYHAQRTWGSASDWQGALASQAALTRDELG